MANANLKNNLYKHNGENQTYTALAMKESRLNKAKEKCKTTKDCAEFEQLGGESELKNLSELIHQEQKSDYSTKKIGMDTGRENQFIQTHEKDRDNANPTKVGGVPQPTKGSVNRKIMSNKEVYNEGIKKEISSIRYLIEYMNNNNKKQNL